MNKLTERERKFQTNKAMLIVYFGKRGYKFNNDTLTRLSFYNKIDKKKIVLNKDKKSIYMVLSAGRVSGMNKQDCLMLIKALDIMGGDA